MVVTLQLILSQMFEILQFNMARFNLSVLVFWTLFNFGLSIMCYECNSATNPQCSEADLPISLRRNCSDHDRGVTHTLCRKIVQFVDFEVNGQQPASRVIRSCGWDESKYKGSCYHRSGYGGRQEVCSCTRDLCNRSTEVSSTATIILTFLIMITNIQKL